MDEEFPMVPITDSSALSAAGYKDDELRVTFRVSGKTYSYPVQGPAVYALLLKAPSKGRFMQSLLATGTEVI